MTESQQVVRSLNERLEVVWGERGPLLRSDAEAILELSSVLRSLSTRHTGSFVTLGGLTLTVSLDAHSKMSSRVCLPADSWNIAASKFAEVATDREDRLLFFGDCGYVFPPPRPDIGVELLGEPKEDVPLGLDSVAS